MEPYELTLDDERQIIQLRLGEHMSGPEHVAARDELVALCRKTGMRRILIDASDLAERPTPWELFNFAAGWPAILREAPVVVAGVLPRNEAARQWWRFGEDTAVNRGLISHRFETLEEARAWLVRW